MEFLTGHGAPTVYTVANPGALYQDIDTGRFYECYDIYRQTSNLISDVKTEYRWKVYLGNFFAQPDWDQNDPTQPDYIKNRTHFYKDKELVTLMEEQTVSFTIPEGESIGQIISPVYIDLVAGSTYTVKFDGIEFDCVAKQKDEIVFIGNGLVFGGGNTGEPFIYAPSDHLNGVWLSYDAEKNHTISVVESRIGIQKIPKKFIPWDESNFKEPIYMSRSPNYWTPEEKEECYNKWRKGHAIIINYNNNSSTLGIVISMYYTDLVGLQMCLISSNGELYYWKTEESTWGRSDITEYGINETVNRIIDNKLGVIENGSY